MKSNSKYIITQEANEILGFPNMLEKYNFIEFCRNEVGNKVYEREKVINLAIEMRKIDNDKRRLQTYRSIISENIQIMRSLDVKDCNGKMLEYGSSVINNIKKQDSDNTYNEAIDSVIGEEKWKRLKTNWRKLKLMSILY